MTDFRRKKKRAVRSLHAFFEIPVIRPSDILLSSKELGTTGLPLLLHLGAACFHLLLHLGTTGLHFLLHLGTTGFHLLDHFLVALETGELGGLEGSRHGVGRGRLELLEHFSLLGRVGFSGLALGFDRLGILLGGV